MTVHDPTLCRMFVTRAKAILAKHPQIRHEWSIDADEDHCILDIPKAEPDGFDITVEVDPEEIIIFGQGFHLHFDEGGIDAKVESSLGLIRDLLGPGMRIMECLIGGTPYRWDAQSFQNGQWITENTSGRFFRKYFGERTYKIYQNKVLEARRQRDV